MIKMIEFCDLLKYIISYFITRPKMISIIQFRKGSTILHSSVLQNYSSGKPNVYCLTYCYIFMKDIISYFFTGPKNISKIHLIV